MHTENKTNTVSLSVSTWVFMAFFMLSPICAAEKMDILFIAIDDMNDWTTVFDKNNPIQTPNLERLAARGAFFEKAYCASASCNPSRTATLTGLRPSTSGVYNNPSGSLRGLKRDLLEGGHRVPFIASWPKGGIKDGRRIDSTLSLADLFATIAAMIGVPLEDGVAEDSLDILPTLLSDEPVRTELVYHAANGKLGLRQGDWAYLRRGGITDEPGWFQEYWQGDSLDAPALLFDLSSDLAQKTNLRTKHPNRVKRMEERLAEIEKGTSTR